jgi:DNA polymerase I-like protein with 3'-5' exonuclease and polymerase domains
VEHLRSTLRERRPNLVIALGNTPLWALTGHEGITKWRGSELWSESAGVKVIPTFHPADVLRAWTHRPIVIQDFRRARREALTRHVTTPQWEFVVEPSLDDIREWFATYGRDNVPLVSDTEGWGRVDCVGFASDSTHAICVPFAKQTDPESPHYWPDRESELAAATLCVEALRRHPTTFHNAIWDCQVIARSLGILPRLRDDTQVAQHVSFPGLLGGRIDPVSGRVDKKGSSLSLSFIASMYCEHYRYWKDDGRLFDPSVGDERTYWRYNCEDVVRTAECQSVLIGEGGVVDKLRLRDQYRFLMSLFGPVLKMMFRGIRYDVAEARRQREWLAAEATATREWLNTATGIDLNPDSTPQMRALFYEDLRLPALRNRKTGAPTLDDAALDSLKRKNPLLYPLISQIQNYRTLDGLATSLDAQASADGRMRTALNIAMVETMRFSSNETAFGEGMNLQNIKRPDSE